jgi:serine protein kinase
MEQKMRWIEEANVEDRSLNEVLTFHNYVEEVTNHPVRSCRPSYLYLLDMLNHFGQDDHGQFKLFQLEHPDSPPVFGQIETQQALYQNLINFKEEGLNNKFILLVGPNGCGKSSLVRKFMKGAEEYSKSDDGKLFTFSWIFPIDNYVKGTLGLSKSPSSDREQLNSYANLEDKDIVAIVQSELHDHPLLLIPRGHRQKLLEELLASKPAILESIKKSYLYRGDLSKKNRMIYDALLKNHKGNHQEVLKHIRVERYNVSKRYSSCAVTIEPQLHVDARLQQITMDKRLANLPPSLQSLNLFQLHGEVVLANRGILEFSDLLKRPLDTFKYLLMTMETSNINLQGILTELDIFFVGTSNEIHLTAFKQHPDYNSFKGRFNFVQVPYLLNYHFESQIYQEQISGLKEKSSLEPHALDALCLFTVMTRLRPCLGKNYEDKILSKTVTALNPLEKALFIGDHQIPARFDVEARQVLKQNHQKLNEEYCDDTLYEGKFGISPREIKKIIYDLSYSGDTLTVVEVLSYLEALIQQKNEYDFLNMSAQGDFHHPARFLSLLKEHNLDILDSELRNSLGLVDDRSYEGYIQRYIENISSKIKGEKIKNQITGKYEPFDDFLIKEFEESIELKEDSSGFQSHLISKLGAYSLDHPQEEIIYCNVFPDITERLQQSFRNEQKKAIKQIAKNIVFYEAELSNQKHSVTEKTPISSEDRKHIDKVIGHMTEKYRYSKMAALSLVKYLIKERY